MTNNKTIYLLTGDIGGTNSRMGLYDVTSEQPICVKYYQNEKFLGVSSQNYEDLIISPFLKMAWETVENIAPIAQSEIYACLACAGFVQHNSVKMTNLNNREINGTNIQNNSSCKYLKAVKVCTIINDFVAQGYGCLTLKKDEVIELIPGSWEKSLQNEGEGPKVCIGAGTGLGQCYLTPSSDSSYKCFGSEGGHVEYNPRNELEIELRAYLMKRFNSTTRLSIERIVSGKGLANVFEFLCYKYPEKVDAAIKKEFDEAGDQQGKVVAVNAAKDDDPTHNLCKLAIDIMISAYGSEVGSGALKWIPTGGLYVTGGLTPKNIHHIHIPGETSNFLEAFYDKGRLHPLLKEIPLLAVMTEDLGVRGAHYVANQMHK